MSNAKRNAPAPTADLEFDVTQQIDPALADLLRSNTEPTLTQVNFDDIEIAPSPPPQPISRGR